MVGSGYQLLKGVAMDTTNTFHCLELVSVCCTTANSTMVHISGWRAASQPHTDK